MNRKYLSIIAGAIISLAVAYQQGFTDSSKTTDTPQNRKTTALARAYQEYNDALRLLWTTVYKNTGNTLYCNQPFSTKSRKERAKADVNAEHVFPMSWVAKDLGCGSRKQCQASSAKFRQIESDLHNIYPAGRLVNKARSNYRFGEVAGEPRQFGSCDFEVDDNRRVAEPTSKKRGEIARAMLYLAHQYNLSLHSKTERLMHQWDRDNPPNAEEKRRESIIHQQQGRENPFITRYPFTH